MREPDQAYKFATMILDDHTRDPDSDESVLARQYIRMIDALRHVTDTAHRQRMILPTNDAQRASCLVSDVLKVADAVRPPNGPSDTCT